MPCDWHDHSYHSTGSAIGEALARTVEMFAEEAQLFAGKLRDSAREVSAPLALMAFASKLREAGRDIPNLLAAIGLGSASFELSPGARLIN